jgi:hypothetical protein
MNPTVAKFVSTLFHARDQAHVFHLQTTSFAAHKALNEFYDGIVDLVDSYVETFQGRYGILTGYPPMGRFLEGDGEVLKYFTALQKFVDTTRSTLPENSDLNNIVDEISALVSSTIYKLKFLK